MICKTFFAAGLLTMLAAVTHADSGFLDDYSVLVPQPSQEGTERIYIAAGAEEQLPKYNAVMVDQPEIHFSAASEYRGMKPEDIQAISDVLRTAMSEKLTAGGYKVVDQPGANVLYLRTALSELYVKKKKRRLMSYTPMGVVAHAGKALISETLQKIDIIEMTLEAESLDGLSGDVLGAIVLQRGARKAKGQKEQRMDLDAFRKLVQEYAAVFIHRLDNMRTEVSPENRTALSVDLESGMSHVIGNDIRRQ